MEPLIKEINREIEAIKVSVNDNHKKLCPDQVVGELIFNGNEFVEKELWIDRDSRKKDKQRLEISEISDKKRILIILESPHKEEFEEDFIAPAMGNTGVNFEKYFVENFNKIIQKHNLTVKVDEYELIFMNAIQYQTSLGVDTTFFRDRVWLQMWIDKRKDFTSRLKKYNPDILFNLCTEGNHINDPIYVARETSYLNNIRYDYIKKIGLSLKRCTKNGRLTKGKEIIYHEKYIKGEKLNTMNYKLYDFVQTEIDKCNLEKCKKFQGPHPSSGNFKRLGDLCEEI